MIANLLAAALNHLLEAEEWARERLAPFAGETVELAALPLAPLRLTIQAGGLLRPAQQGAEPSLKVGLRTEAPAALLRGEEHFLRALEISGNAKLANEVMFLARHLRWDFEEDLSRLFGDVAAHRMAEAGRGFAAWQADAGRRLADSLAQYAVEERKLVLGRGELDAHAAAVARLRDALERLEQRVRRLG